MVPGADNDHSLMKRRMHMRTNADLLADALYRRGVRHVYGIPSGENLAVVDALRRRGISFVLVSNEASAGFMADVEGRLMGRPGVCLSTLGPGACNMTTGVGNAFLDRSPLVALTAQVRRALHGRVNQMHVEHRLLYSPITKWSGVITPGAVEWAMARAFRLAAEEIPGAVHLDMPQDVMEGPIVAETIYEEPITRDDLRASPDVGVVEEILRKARYPVMAVGITAMRGGLGAGLTVFAERHGIPVVSTVMGKGSIPSTHPLFVGVVGRARSGLVYDTIAQADLVLGVGYDPVEINYEAWMPRAPLVHMDSRPVDIDDMQKVKAQVVSHPSALVKALNNIPPISNGWDHTTLAGAKEKLRSALRPRVDDFSPHHVVDILEEMLPEEHVLSFDVGAHTHLIAQMWERAAPGRFLVSNGWSSMGFAVPAAIAAQLHRPNSRVACITGDGGFLMMAGEMATVGRLGTPVVFIVLVDGDLSLIAVRERKRRIEPYGIHLFDRRRPLADSVFGVPARIVTTETCFRKALGEALESRAPCIIKAVVDPSEYYELL